MGGGIPLIKQLTTTLAKDMGVCRQGVYQNLEAPFNTKVTPRYCCPSPK